MAAVQDTAYPKLKHNITKKEITRIYTPLDEEILFANQFRYTADKRFLCLLYIKCFQRLGYFPKPNEVPQSILVHIASFSRVTVDQRLQFPILPKATHKRIKDAVPNYFAVKTFDLAVHHT